MRKLLLALLFGAISTNAYAKDVVVEMWTVDPVTKTRNMFNPGVITIEKGDTVVWVASQPSHNVEFLPGAVPEGVGKFRSKFDKEIRYTFDDAGVYGYKCTPHYALGMIGLIVVDDDYSNIDTFKNYKFPNFAKKRAKTILADLEKLKSEHHEAGSGSHASHK